MTRKNQKVVKYRKPFSLNVGTIVFLLVLTYLGVVSYRYFTKEHVTIYEVTETRVADDNRIKGLILRNEVIVYSDKAGYVNYYANEGTRVGKNTTVYTLDDSGKLSDYLSEVEEKAKDNVNSEVIRRNIAQYKNAFDWSNYGKLRDLKYDLGNSVIESYKDANLLSDLQKAMGEGVNFEMLNAQQSGILSYTLDGMEGLTVEDVSWKMFENPEAERTQLREQSTVNAGSPVYKLVPSEEWSIVIPLTYEQLEKIKDKDAVNIKICKDNLSIQVGLAVMELDGKPFAKLDLKKYMIRYLTERFLDVELVINSAEGLKIPTKSIFEKECFLIPKSFLMEGGNSTAGGVVKEAVDEEGETVFEFTEIYVIMEKEDKLYVDAASLQKGDWIQNSLQERMQLLDTGRLEGVYSVNEGFCKFRRVEKLYENPEYSIVKKDVQYGLSVFDHIVVNPAYLNVEDLIY